MVEEIRSALVRHTLWIRGIAQNFEHIPRTSYAEVRHALAHPNMRPVYWTLAPLDVVQRDNMKQSVLQKVSFVHQDLVAVVMETQYLAHYLDCLRRKASSR